MPAEAWVALGIGLAGIAGSIIGGVWYLSFQFAKAVTRFEVIDLSRGSEIGRINTAVEKIEVAVASIAVDRAHVAGLEHRISKLEQWYDELRRGIGKIT